MIAGYTGLKLDFKELLGDIFEQHSPRPGNLWRKAGGLIRGAFAVYYCQKERI